MKESDYGSRYSAVIGTLQSAILEFKSILLSHKGFKDTKQSDEYIKWEIKNYKDAIDILKKEMF